MNEQTTTDYLQSFYWERLPLRGARCRVDGIFRRVLRDLTLPPELAKLLGEILVGLALLSTTQKHYVRLILQAQSEGFLRLLTAELQQGGGMRAYLRWQEEETEILALDRLRQGILALTVDLGLDRDRYQGLIELRETLTASLIAYFTESVQSPAYFRFVIDLHRGIAGGYFLQRLPGILATEDWQTALQFFAVGSDQSLLMANPEQFLPEIFPEEGVRLRFPEPLHFECSCSLERVERMLLALGETEVRQTLDQEGEIKVTCEFCQAVYRLDEAAVASLFAPAGPFH